MVNTSLAGIATPTVNGRQLSKPSFAVEVGGRQFPTFANLSTVEGAETPTELVRIENDYRILRTALIESIENTVRGNETLHNAITLRQAIAIYSVQLDSLKAMCNQWNILVAHIMKIDGFTVGEHPSAQSIQQVMKERVAWQSELSTNGSMPRVLSENIVTARLASLPISDLKVQLEKDIDAKVEGVCTHILAQLVQSVDQQVLSFIEWYGDGACSYQRFTRRFEVEQNSTETVSRRLEFNESGFRENLKVRTNGKTNRVLCRHIQHLVNAKSNYLAESEVLIPREQQAIVNSIPAWLSPLVRIVEGTLIRETLIEQNLSVHEWETTEDKVQWHNDPAIILGPFVLSSWGPKEISEELVLNQKEDQERTERTANREALNGLAMSPFQSAGFGSLGLSVVFFFGQQSDSFSLIIGTVLAAIAIFFLTNPQNSNSKKSLIRVGGKTEAHPLAISYAIGFVVCIVCATLSLSVGRWIVAIVNLAASFILVNLYFDSTISLAHSNARMRSGSESSPN